MDFQSEWFRVTEKDGWTYRHDDGNESIVRKGQLLSIANIHTAEKLFAEGKILPREMSTRQTQPTTNRLYADTKERSS